MPAYDPHAVGGGIPSNVGGSMCFSLFKKQYEITWGSKGIWCELCALEEKGDPVEVGSTGLGSFWVPAGRSTKEVAIEHLAKHIEEA